MCCVGGSLCYRPVSQYLIKLLSTYLTNGLKSLHRLHHWNLIRQCRTSPTLIFSTVISRVRFDKEVLILFLLMTIKQLVVKNSNLCISNYFLKRCPSPSTRFFSCVMSTFTNIQFHPPNNYKQVLYCTRSLYHLLFFFFLIINVNFFFTNSKIPTHQLDICISWYININLWETGA